MKKTIPKEKSCLQSVRKMEGAKKGIKDDVKCSKALEYSKSSMKWGVLARQTNFFRADEQEIGVKGVSLQLSNQ